MESNLYRKEAMRQMSLKKEDLSLNNPRRYWVFLGTLAPSPPTHIFLSVRWPFTAQPASAHLGPGYIHFSTGRVFNGFQNHKSNYLLHPAGLESPLLGLFLIYPSTKSKYTGGQWQRRTQAIFAWLPIWTNSQKPQNASNTIEEYRGWKRRGAILPTCIKPQYFYF